MSDIKVTPEDITNCIDKIQYHVFDGTTVTVCCITMKNGFTVTGESACVDPENFNAQIGKDIAYKNAENKLWAFLGYELNLKKKSSYNGGCNCSYCNQDIYKR